MKVSPKFVKTAGIVLGIGLELFSAYALNKDFSLWPFCAVLVIIGGGLALSSLSIDTSEERKP